MIKTRAAMPGNPSYYEHGLQNYSIEALQKLKNEGINTIFINLAWSRPHIDVVTLEHVAVSKSFPLLSNETDVIKNRKKINERIANAKALGLKTMILVGMPQYFDYELLPDSYEVLKGASTSTIAEASVTCIESPDTKKLYQELMKDFLENVPDIDGFLVYTYDELAEICSEDSDCPRCHGIPQEDRISKFLNEIFEYMQSMKAGLELWWEPWELSWAQVYGILEKLNVKITVSCHSTLHEVYFVNHPDIWFRSIAALCHSQGRAMIAELFMGGTGEDLGFTAMYPCPRLVFEQIDMASRIQGVTGVKEYYGLCPQYMSVNEKVMGKRLLDTDNYDRIIKELAMDYSSTDPEDSRLLEFWSITSRVLELVPWELSWAMRMYNYHPYDKEYWGQVNFGDLMKTPWKTPSWLSNRRSYYMVSSDTKDLTKEYCKDIDKRFKKCIELLDQALEISQELYIKSEYQAEIDLQKESVCLLKFFLYCRWNHLKLSVAMAQLRAEDHDLEELRCILFEELNNANNLKMLIESSDIPYMLSPETIESGIWLIKEFMEEIELGRDTVLLNHRGL